MILPEVRNRLASQRAMSHAFFPVLGAGVAAAVYLRGYRVEGRRELRRRFAELAAQHDGPIIFCPNHLTMIDSVLLNRALASNWIYLRRFGLFPWNIPEWENIRSNAGLRFLCYVGKCMPIRRMGTLEQKRAMLDKLVWLLEQGDSVCIFPEGTRSKTGRLDTENFGYGVGQLAVRVPSAAILCAYVRGDTQTTSTGWPHRDDRIYVDFELIKPTSRHKGLRAARDISVQAMDSLRKMEEKYFKQHPSAVPLAGDGLEPAV